MKATDMLPVLGAALDTFVASKAKNKSANTDKYFFFTLHHQ